MNKLKIYKLISGSALFIFIFFISINSVFAVEKRTTTLDLTNHDTENKLAEEGWSWDNRTKTLILENSNFEVNDKSNCINLPEGDVIIEFKGNNTLKADKGTIIYGNHKANIIFQSSNNGILNLEINASNDNIGRTINYPYNLDIKSGTINSRGGFFTDGVVTISGGTVNINTEDMTYGSSDTEVKGIYALRQVNITGGNVDIKSKSAAINVVGIKNATDYPDGVVIRGGNISLSTQAPDLPAIFVGNYQTKNIVIDGGNITLGGGYGAYTANGVIKVNHFDSLNTKNVKKEVFRVSSNIASNKIIYADADYSKVDDAIKKANSLDKAKYKNFNLVEQAIAAVVRGKNVLEQSEVDAMAEDINKAIGALKLNDEMQNIVNPNTSDINLNLLIGLIVISSCGIVYTLKKVFN